VAEPPGETSAADEVTERALAEFALREQLCVELTGDLVCIPKDGQVEEGDVGEERSKVATTWSPNTVIP
jgi:hypothetical protein